MTLEVEQEAFYIAQTALLLTQEYAFFGKSDPGFTFYLNDNSPNSMDTIVFHSFHYSVLLFVNFCL